MRNETDDAGEIRDALDREAARRFDAARLAAHTLSEGHGSRAFSYAAPYRGPIGGLPVPVQWLGLAAALLGAVLGVRSLYRERTAPVSSVAQSAREATSAPAGKEGIPEPPAPERPVRRVPPEPAAPAPKPVEIAAIPPVPDRAQSAPHEPAPVEAEPRTVGGTAPTVVEVPDKKEPVASRTGLAAPGAIGPGTIATLPSDAVQRAGLVGGVRVVSLTIGGRSVDSIVREAPEIGATLVLLPPRSLTPVERRISAQQAAELERMLASVGIRRDAGTERQARKETEGRVADGALYARLLVATELEASSASYGVKGNGGEGLEVVPLREQEIWSDSQAERAAMDVLGAPTFAALGGMRVRSARSGGVGASFVAAAAGRIFDVSVDAAPSTVPGTYRVELKIAPRLGDESTSSAAALEAGLIVENGRIAVLGVPRLRVGRERLEPFLIALSPQFEALAKANKGDVVYSLDDRVDPPVIVEKVRPEYPRAARERGIEGKVVLRAVIRKDGSVDGVQVLQVPEASGSELLIEAAAAAVREWRYLPGELDGEPVDVAITVTVRFSLRQDEGDD